MDYSAGSTILMRQYEPSQVWYSLRSTECGTAVPSTTTGGTIRPRQYLPTPHPAAPYYSQPSLQYQHRYANTRRRVAKSVPLCVCKYA
eukprot:2944778-Rhodomonas_salina.1